MLICTGHPARAPKRKRTAAVSSRPAEPEARATSYARDSLNDDFTGKDGSAGQKGRGCTDDAVEFLDGVADKGEECGLYRVKRRRGTDFCISQPEGESNMKYDENECMVECDYYLDKKQIQRSGIDICGEYTRVFVDGSIGQANVLVTTLQAHSTAVVADCTTTESTRLAKTVGIP